MQLFLIDISHVAIVVFLLLAVNHTGCWPESTLLLRTRWTYLCVSCYPVESGNYKYKSLCYWTWEGSVAKVQPQS